MGCRGKAGVVMLIAILLLMLMLIVLSIVAGASGHDGVATSKAEAYRDRFRSEAKLDKAPPLFIIFLGSVVKPLLLILAFGFSMSAQMVQKVVPKDQEEGETKAMQTDTDQTSAPKTAWAEDQSSTALPDHTNFFTALMARRFPAPAKLLTNFLMLAALASDILGIIESFASDELPIPMRFCVALTRLSSSGNIASTLTALGFYALHRGDMNVPTMDGGPGNNSPWPTLIVPNLDELCLRGNYKAWRWVTMKKETLATFDGATRFYLYVLVYLYRYVFTAFMIYIFPAGLMYPYVAAVLFSLIIMINPIVDKILPFVLRFRIRLSGVSCSESSSREIKGIIQRMELSPREAATLNGWGDGYDQAYLLQIFGDATTFDDQDRKDKKKASQIIVKRMPTLPVHGMLSRVTGADAEIWRDYFAYVVCGSITFCIMVPLATHFYITMWYALGASTGDEAMKTMGVAYYIALWETISERKSSEYFGQIVSATESGAKKGLASANLVWMWR